MNILTKIVFLGLFKVTLLSAEFDIFEISFHGNFCGNNTPSFENKTPQEEKALLEKMPAIDIVDEACKRHDICYLSRGENDITCDNELVTRVQKVRKNLDKKSCRMLSKAIIIYFDTINYNPITIMRTDDTMKNKLRDMPIITAENMFNMASFSTDVAINFGYTKPVGYMFDSKNNTERRKEIFQMFPPRYKACVIK